MWSVIGDIRNRRYYYWTEHNRRMRIVDLNKLDFGCGVSIIIFAVLEQNELKTAIASIDAGKFISFLSSFLVEMVPDRKSKFVTQIRRKMSTTLITNVNVFDGVNEKLIEEANVLVEGNKIKQDHECAQPITVNIQ